MTQPDTRPYRLINGVLTQSNPLDEGIPLIDDPDLGRVAGPLPSAESIGKRYVVRTISKTTPAP